MDGFELRTSRLVLRQWRDADRGPFAAMNADVEVMKFFPRTLEPQESDALVDEFQAEFEQSGFCPFVVGLRGEGSFLGFLGLHSVSAEMAFAPAVEVGWRLEQKAWGHGYATEAGARALRFGFDDLGLDEIVSFTAAVNVASRRVMERLAMVREPTDDFDHPRIPPGHRLGPHVLYRAKRGIPQRT